MSRTYEVSVFDHDSVIENTISAKGYSFKLGELVVYKHNAEREYRRVVSQVFEGLAKLGVVELDGGEVYLVEKGEYLDDESDLAVKVEAIKYDPNSLTAANTTYRLKVTL